MQTDLSEVEQAAFEAFRYQDNSSFYLLLACKFGDIKNAECALEYLRRAVAALEAVMPKAEDAPASEGAEA